MLGFRITYLRGSVTAADIRGGNEKDQVEWPPHPDRLFCALVQAWGDLGENEPGERALRWLEELHETSPPLIRSGELLSVTVVPRHVPVNDKWDPISKKGKCESIIQGTLIGRNRQPRRIPTSALSDDVVLIWWPDASATREQFEELQRLAIAVASLGHSSSLASVEAFNELGPVAPTWVPRENGSIALRVPHSGRLQHLRDAYSSDPRRRPAISNWATYGPPSERREILRGQHKDLFMFRLTGEGAPAAHRGRRQSYRRLAKGAAFCSGSAGIGSDQWAR
jgi:CRISPR-associated protein Csb2